jgi:hypothetical protein
MWKQKKKTAGILGQDTPQAPVTINIESMNLVQNQLKQVCQDRLKELSETDK